MPRLHLVTAHRTMDRSDDPSVVYCGYNADTAGKVRDEVLGKGEFALADKWTPDTKHTRYASAENQAKAKAKHVVILQKIAKGKADADKRKAAAKAKAEAAFAKTKVDAEAEAAEAKLKADADAAAAAEKQKADADAAAAAGAQS
jgi:hypothetical protein